MIYSVMIRIITEYRRDNYYIITDYIIDLVHIDIDLYDTFIYILIEYVMVYYQYQHLYLYVTNHIHIDG